MTKLDLNDKVTYIAIVKGWGRKEMLSMLHGRGLKEGRKFLSDEQLAEALYHFARLHN